MPGNGSLTASIEMTADVKAIVTGKPNTYVFGLLREKHKVQKEKILFIGDNLRTDIKFANGAEVDSYLVLTGVTGIENLEGLLEQKDTGIPTYIGHNLNFKEVDEVKDE